MNERSISFKIGKGSLNHNARKFIADNVDSNRTQYNIEYVSKDIKQVYHELFDDAVASYNAKQTRTDRMINDYYEKIRTGKQEKLFHEVIVQVGNMDDMNCLTVCGDLGKMILDEYMKNFQERNPNLYVFSAHLHMDEQTPHLHIDFIPYTTGSKRGLETRVSLKQALKAQGFSGGSRSETEWNQWVQSEKKELAKVMEKYEFKWKELETHNEPLDVLNYKKSKRKEEVAELEKKVDQLEKEYTLLDKSRPIIHEAYKAMDDESYWSLPEPTRFMSASTYTKTTVQPKFSQLRALIQPLINEFFKQVKECINLQSELIHLRNKNVELNELVEDLSYDRRKLYNEMNKIKRFFSKDTIEDILEDRIVRPKRKEHSR